MKAATLKRLDRLQLAATVSTRRVVVLCDLSSDPDALAAFWEGDESVLPDRPDGLPAATVHAVVIAPTLAAFEAYWETVGPDENDLEAVERQREAEERRKAAKQREAEHQARVEAAEAERVRYDYSGYPLPPVTQRRD
jgi:hypothetical protein